MERIVECCNGCRSVYPGAKLRLVGTDSGRGPAHAVYFAAYEATKHALGGNEGGSDQHHPLAAGAQSPTNTILGIVTDHHQLPVVLQPQFPAMR
jgi:hypothetical protein